MKNEQAPKQIKIETGTASILISLSNGNITITHGVDGEVLHQVINAKNGSWDQIWKTLRGLKGVNS